MDFMRLGRQRLALLSTVTFALILSDCAMQSTPGVLAPNNPSVRTRQKTFHYTGKGQTFIVPAGVTKITITADGASGADTSYGTGGLGGLVTATVTVTPDKALGVYVGGSGSDGGFNGGGTGNGSGSNASAMGGGASDVRNSVTGRRIVLAGGGGGAGAPSGSTDYGGSPAPTTDESSGGNGGGSKAGDGRTGDTGSYRESGGGGGDGGTQTAGGNGGDGPGSHCSGDAGAAGIRLQGGGGGDGCYDSGQGGGGGGGGGYFGGGGGGGSDESCGATYYGEYHYCAWGGGGGGGGGSSYIETGATDIKNVRGGAPAGDGLVVISW